MRTHSVDAFVAQDPVEDSVKAVDHALRLTGEGKLASFFIEIDGGSMDPEAMALLETINGFHVNVGSWQAKVNEMGVNSISSESREVTPRSKEVDGEELAPRGQQVILENRAALEKVFSIVLLQSGGRIVVDKTTRSHQEWLDSVVAKSEKRRLAANN